MEIVIKISWLLLGLLHVKPSLVLFSPELANKLYGVDPAGIIGTLLIHRAAMFFTIVVVSVYAILDPNARRLASLVVAISMVGFLLVYARAGMPAGALRSIALADLIGLLPLTIVLIAALNIGVLTVNGQSL